MAENKMNQYEELIWKHLEGVAAQDPVFAEKLKDEKHSIKGCMQYITGEARKQAVQGCAMVEDQVVYGWAIHYYDEEVKEPEVVAKPATITAKPAKPTAKKRDSKALNSANVQTTTQTEKAPQNAPKTPEQPKKAAPKPKQSDIFQLSFDF
ncbi:MAG: PcfK-like family protein [Bacteroidales bacterium]|nr:PcfK-like family protein [Candidatus Colicola equi]